MTGMTHNRNFFSASLAKEKKDKSHPNRKKNSVAIMTSSQEHYIWTEAHRRAASARRHRLVNTAVGAAIGGAVGFAVAGAPGAVGGKVLGTAIGGGAGAFLGDLVSPGEHHPGSAIVGGALGGALGGPAASGWLAAGSSALGGYAGEAARSPDVRYYVPEATRAYYQRAHGPYGARPGYNPRGQYASYGAAPTAVPYEAYEPSQVRLTGNARALFEEYMVSDPAIRQIENEEHGVDPLQNPEEFFEDELEEPYHHDVLEDVEDNNGLITSELMAHWIQENTLQHGV